MAKRIELLGVPVDCVDMKQARDVVDQIINGEQAQAVIAVNPEKVIRANDDPELLNQLRCAALLIPDGIGVVLAAKILNKGKMRRVPGSELMPEICELAAQKGYKIFLLGGSDEVNQKTENVLRERYTDIQIVGRQNGYVEDQNMPAVVEAINQSKADILFLALGSPKQELWMTEYLPQLNIKVCQGVGGTFDVIAGRVKRAPFIFRTIHLEWLYRLMSQPNRLLRQKALPEFAFRILQQKFFRESR